VIDDRAGRPIAERGGPFTNVAIEAGSRFRAEVWLPTGFGVDWSGLDHSRQRIGSSRKDDYGLVEITAVEIPEAQPDEGDDRGNTVAPEKGAEFTALAVTDLVLTDSRGAPDLTVEAWARELSTALGGVKVTPVKDSGPWLAVTRHEGWQRAWGLARPSIIAIAAGSVAKFTADDAVTTGALERLAAEGVGLRRTEGFGRVAINHPVLDPEVTTITIKDWEDDEGVQSEEAEGDGKVAAS
jgi:CRISPR-associated protein Csx10